MMILTGVLFRKSFTPFNILLYRLHFVSYAAKSDPDSRFGFRIRPGSFSVPLPIFKTSELHQTSFGCILLSTSPRTENRAYHAYLRTGRGTRILCHCSVWYIAIAPSVHALAFEQRVMSFVGRYRRLIIAAF